MQQSILIVDDEPSWARNFGRYLERRGLAVKVTGSLDEARRCIEAFRPALICLDICLPDGDGIAFLEELRAAGNRCACLLVTAHASAGARAAAERLQAEIIEKPASMAMLRDRAADLVEAPGSMERPFERARPQAPTVVMYSHDGYGLGHMRRNLNIARQLVKRDPSTHVLMIIGCPSGLFFELPPNIDFIKLPSIVKVGEERWESNNLSMSPNATFALRAAMILQSVKALQPDVFMVDYLAQGVGGELLATLDWLRCSGASCKLVLGLREIIDTPGAVRGRWRDKGVLDTMIRHFDRVLLYGEEHVFATAEHYGLAERIGGRLRYCGYVAPPVQPMAPCPDGVARIIVTGGGGRDGAALARAAIEVRRRMAGEAVHMTLVTGPLMDRAERDELAALALDVDGIKLLPWVEDISALTADASAVVCMAGYNSLTEILAQGHRPIVLPRQGPSQEQRIRASLFAGFGLIEALDPDLFDTDMLERALRQQLEAGPADQGERPFTFDGATRAATELSAFLAPRTTNKRSERLRA